jgi:DNA-binding transcriptional MerR regulator
LAEVRDKDRSIGEVIEELKDDFPDISVSKIRFLESQGLINPRRTPSGYRQFSNLDVALLRWILTLQRDHYLPLKVIRRRLRDGEGPDTEPVEDAAPEEQPAATVAEPASVAPAEQAAPTARAALRAVGTESLWESKAAERVYTRAELARKAGVDEKALDELSSYGLLPEHLDDEALRVARLAAGFMAYGVEARHLRMYKSFAEREAALLEQVVMPLLKPRREGSAARARDSLAELARLGQEMRLSMLRVALGPPPPD